MEVVEQKHLEDIFKNEGKEGATKKTLMEACKNRGLFINDERLRELLRDNPNIFRAPTYKLGENGNKQTAGLRYFLKGHISESVNLYKDIKNYL